MSNLDQQPPKGNAKERLAGLGSGKRRAIDCALGRLDKLRTARDKEPAGQHRSHTKKGEHDNTPSPLVRNHLKRRRL